MVNGEVVVMASSGMLLLPLVRDGDVSSKYDVINAPPLFAGALKYICAVELPRVHTIFVMVGALGTPSTQSTANEQIMQMKK
jgi:hypothetical protein